MLSGMLGRKVGMTQIFGPNGIAIPVTVIEAGPCAVTQVKTEANDGYEAVQLGFGETSTKHAKRPMLGHLGHSLTADATPAPQAAAGAGEGPPGGARGADSRRRQPPRPRPTRLRARRRDRNGLDEARARGDVVALARRLVRSRCCAR